MAFDRLLRRPRRDEQRLEQQLVIAVHVAAVLAVDDVRPHLVDDGLQLRDHLGERHGVEPLIAELQQPDLVRPERARRAHRVGLEIARRGRVAQRLAFAHDHRRHVIAGFDVEGDRSPAAQDLVVWMGGDDEDASVDVMTVDVAAAVTVGVTAWMYP